MDPFAPTSQEGVTQSLLKNQKRNSPDCLGSGTSIGITAIYICWWHKSYLKLTPEQNAIIAKYVTEHGVAKVT